MERKGPNGFSLPFGYIRVLKPPPPLTLKKRRETRDLTPPTFSSFSGFQSATPPSLEFHPQKIGGVAEREREGGS